MTELLTAADNAEGTVLVLLDCSKASDCIHHTVLLSILECISFSNDSIYVS